MSPSEMSTPSVNVLSIIKELSAALGKEAVQAACEQFVGGKKKEKKERKARGKSSWNLEVDKVLEEMQAATGEGEKVTYKMAYAETSRRKREGDPEAQLKYEAYRAKVETKRAQAEQKKIIAKPPVAPSSTPSKKPVTDANVYNFLFGLKDSGLASMQNLTHNMDCLTYLQEEFGMSKEEAEVYRKKYVTNYRELLAKYHPETSAESADATAEQKKGRGRPKKTTA